MVIGFTGHRRFSHPENKIVKQLKHFLKVDAPTVTISGMALGFDQLAARVCVHLGIPFIAAIPFKEQPDKWSTKAQRQYFKILERAHRIVYVDKIRGYEGDNMIQKFHSRNHWMVDHSDKMIAYYQNTGKGGTAECMRYIYRNFKMVVTLEIR